MMRAVVLAPKLQNRLRRFVVRSGERHASQQLAVSAVSLLRAMAGLPVSRGTVAMIERGFHPASGMAPYIDGMARESCADATRHGNRDGDGDGDDDGDGDGGSDPDAIG